LFERATPERCLVRALILFGKPDLSGLHELKSP